MQRNWFVKYHWGLRLSPFCLTLNWTNWQITKPETIEMLNSGAWSLDMTAGASCRSSRSTHTGFVSRNSIGYPHRTLIWSWLGLLDLSYLNRSPISAAACWEGGFMICQVLSFSAPLHCPGQSVHPCLFYFVTCKTVILWCIHNTSKRPATAARLCCSMTAQPQATKITLAPASFPSLFLGQRLSMCELVKSIIVLLSCLKLKKI